MARGRPTGIAFAEYTDEYKEMCKQAWYAAGRPTNAIQWMDVTPEEEANHRKPNIELLRKWKRERMWDFWADELDAKAVAIVEDNLVAQKSQMLIRQADMAWKLQDAGVEYIEREGFDSSASAVQAIIRGAQLERESRGFGEMMLKMAKMGNEELTAEFITMVNRGFENGQLESTIDADEVPEQKEDDTDIDAVT